MSYKQKIIIIFLAFLLAVNSNFPLIFASAEEATDLDIKAINNYIKRQVKGNRIPGMAVAIVQDDQVVFLKGYGDASFDNEVTPQTQFYIGSVTKSFTALAALQLVEQGKLELDTPVQEYIPWFTVADPQATTAITVRNLLNHTSGLSSKGDPNPETVTPSLETEVRLLANVKPNAVVGTKYQYYNQNYRVIGLLIEQVSGQSYAEYLRDNIFLPLGMTHSVTNPAEAPNLAQGYTRVFGIPVPQSQKYIPGALSSGYVITTAKDMALYMLALLNNKKADGSQLLDPKLVEEMRTPPAAIGSDYGMGWMVVEDGNTLVHGGALQYFQSFVALGLKEKTGITILYNQNSMENMLFENDTTCDGLLDLMNGKKPSRLTFGWIGWILLLLAFADLLNHVRLFWLLPYWLQKTARQPRFWVWCKVLVGILFPLAVIFVLPPLAKYFVGGSASWIEPFGLMPDITIWLLLGMVLNLVRSLQHAGALVGERNDRK